MTTSAQVLQVAESQLGYVEGGGPDGRSGNKTKYWAELQPNFQGASWCAAFVSWVFKHAGKPLPYIDHTWGYSYCPDAVNYAKKHGLWDASGHYSPGDIVFFDWTGHGVAEHTGIVVSDDGKTVVTIEGNTSAEGAGGSQSNGGGVYRRNRPHGPTIMGVLKASKWLAAVKPQPQPAPTVVKHNPFRAPTGTLALGCKSDQQTRTTQVHWVQWAVGVPCDGAFGAQTDKGIREFQRHHLACGSVDGVVGPKTKAVLAKVTH